MLYILMFFIYFKILLESRGMCNYSFRERVCSLSLSWSSFLKSSTLPTRFKFRPLPPYTLLLLLTLNATSFPGDITGDINRPLSGAATSELVPSVEWKLYQISRPVCQCYELPCQSLPHALCTENTHYEAKSKTRVSHTQALFRYQVSMKSVWRGWVGVRREREQQWQHKKKIKGNGLD